MKKIITLLLISFIFIIGCGNKSSDPNSVPPEHKPMVEATTQLNSAMNDSVLRLGNLSGFKQYYSVTDTSSTATKIFINKKEGKIGLAYAYLVNNAPYIQRAQMYSLGASINLSTIAIYLIDGVSPTLVDGVEYAAYTFYDTTVISAEKNISKEDNGSGVWETDADLPNLPMLLDNSVSSVLKIAECSPPFPPDVGSGKYYLANQGTTFESVVDIYKINE